MRSKAVIYISLALMLPLFIACAGTSKVAQEKSDATKEFAIPG